MTRDWKAVAGALVAGILIGAAAQRAFPPKPPKGRMVAHITRKLKLSPEQKQLLQRIVEAKRRRMDALHEENKPKVQAVRESAREEIRAILTPEQQRRFDEMLARWKERRVKHGRPDGPMPHHP
ncbi:MAG: hypothetical protein HY553_13455 [Elusimicrobia bacterium]|nr:hypothetical protein [Elusimicrobiota bacterium]